MESDVYIVEKLDVLCFSTSLVPMRTAKGNVEGSHESLLGKLHCVR